ncbi:hypothetical protein NC99_13480 [Sunxiuqinia dokdonensis]|uniref:Uncharacterized protein n=1 Tax=Sunxiuqinia dokdonensis TaxID=1409788 RepID=A0A0L8VBL0_9BACT|nr:hypothetical protein NC99_13480 [Sunxiuqinia dokdonensis]
MWAGNLNDAIEILITSTAWPKLSTFQQQINIKILIVTQFNEHYRIEWNNAH